MRLRTKIGAINESQLNAGKVRVEQIFSQFRQRLAIAIGLTMGLGLILAAFSIRKILGLETDTVNDKAELKQLSARLVEAHEDERRSIFRELHDEDVSEELPEENKTCIYRIVQEALHNCVQHAGAHNVKIAVQ